MRILIDATSVLLRSAGIKTYTYYWIQHLWQQAGNEHILTFPRLGRLNARAASTWPRISRAKCHRAAARAHDERCLTNVY